MLVEVGGAPTNGRHGGAWCQQHQQVCWRAGGRAEAWGSREGRGAAGAPAQDARRGAGAGGGAGGKRFQDPGITRPLVSEGISQPGASAAEPPGASKGRQAPGKGGSGRRPDLGPAARPPSPAPPEGRPPPTCRKGARVSTSSTPSAYFALVSSLGAIRMAGRPVGGCACGLGWCAANAPAGT